MDEDPWPYGLSLRGLAPGDSGAVVTVQRACYDEPLLESVETFGDRLASPCQCSVGVFGSGGPGGLVAYLAAYQTRLDRITPLHGGFEAASDADTIHIHDLSVLPCHAGRGLAARLLADRLAWARAAGLDYAALVAVRGAQRYWEKQGFRPREPADPRQRRHLASYGDSGCYLIRRL